MEGSSEHGNKPSGLLSSINLVVFVVLVSTSEDMQKL
jgi:hypothetical protein